MHDELLLHRPAEGSSVGRAEIGGTRLDVPRYSVVAPLPGFEGDLEDCCLYAGESCSRVNDVRPAAALVADIVREAREALAVAM